MIISQYLAPTAEPVTLNELKDHLIIDSGTIADNLTEAYSIAPGSHSVSTGFTILGSAVALTSDTALVKVHSGTNQATGTVDVKIQEADAESGPWTDWTGGSFTQITTATDNAIFEKEYTGSKLWIRAASQVLLASCEFDATVEQFAPISSQDAALTMILAAGRAHIENITGRQLMTATWDYYLQTWPDAEFIKIPFGNLQTVTSVKYTDYAGDVTTMTAATDYAVVTNGDQCGKVILPDSVSWPSASLYPENPIVIRFTCGYASAAAVPNLLKAAILFAAEDMWYRGERSAYLKPAIDSQTSNFRLWDEF